MFAFVKNKLLSKKWMVISLLVGNILLISIAACSPMYSDAVLQRMLYNDMTERMSTTGRYPSTILFQGEYNLGKARTQSLENLDQLEQLSAEFMAECEIPVAVTSVEYYRTGVSAIHEATGNSYSDTIDVRLDALSELDDHIQIISGQAARSGSPDGVLEAVVSEKTLMDCGLFVGETLTLDNIKDAATGESFRVKITGVFEPKDQQDPFWYNNPNNLKNFIFIHSEDFITHFVENEANRQNFTRARYIMLDYQQMRGDQVYDLLMLSDTYKQKVGQLYENGFGMSFYEMLDAYLVSANKLDITLIVLQVPIFLLLGVFIFMVSSQMLNMEQNEIAMIKSRGASRRQIIGIYLLQSSILAAISLVAALPLSYLICQVVGSANAFLEFVQRRALPARFYAPVWIFAVVAAVFSVATMVLPAIRYSKVGIVDHKRSRHKQKRPLWQKLFLDVILLAVSLYGLYSYSNQMDFLADRLGSGASMDPLLYLCCSMFILGSALLIVRVFPLLVRLVFTLFKKHWSPALFASFLRILRSQGNQNFIMVFLILTMALGIFSAETAHTINNNAEEKIRYTNGADIVVMEDWSSRQYSEAGQSMDDIEVVYIEPDYNKYEAMQGAEAYTKVEIRNNVQIDGLGLEGAVTTVMGIHTDEFGRVAYMKDGLLNEHWYHYLNAMSQDPEGVLVSTSFRDELGLQLGDRVTYRTDQGAIRGVIYGFVDYWPGLTPPEAGEDGVSYFIVAHLSQLQVRWGVEPYEIWIKNAGGSSQYIYDFAAEQGIAFSTFRDTNADIIELKNDPVFQATNGILTVGFMVVLVLCSVGFLIYWILSIQSRALQFGIFRAMGMTMKEVLGMLVNEQVFISGIALLSGVGIGKLAAQLFVPMIQVAYSSAEQVIPLEISGAGADQLKLYLVVGIVMILCMVILGFMVKKIKIAQALKLGED